MEASVQQRSLDPDPPEPSPVLTADVNRRTTAGWGELVPAGTLLGTALGVWTAIVSMALLGGPGWLKIQNGPLILALSAFLGAVGGACGCVLGGAMSLAEEKLPAWAFPRAVGAVLGCTLTVSLCAFLSQAVLGLVASVAIAVGTGLWTRMPALSRWERALPLRGGWLRVAVVGLLILLTPVLWVAPHIRWRP